MHDILFICLGVSLYDALMRPYTPHRGGVGVQHPSTYRH